MTMYYKLEGKTTVKTDTAGGIDAFNNPERVLEQTQITPDVMVSTVFLVIDHAFGCGPPVLFETMVFGGRHDGYQERYHTWDEAIAGHSKAIDMVRSCLSMSTNDKPQHDS